MSRKKPTIAEARSLREQMEAHIFEVVRDYESLTGLTVTGINIHRERKPGFGAKETMEINVNTEL